MGNLPPGYVPPVDQKKTLTKNQKKNERKKQKRKENATTESDEQEVVEVTEKISDMKTSGTVSEDSTVDIAKKKKGLLKKLKQIQQLEERQSKGEVLEKEQIEKISKKKEFEE